MNEESRRSVIQAPTFHTCAHVHRKKEMQGVTAGTREEFVELNKDAVLRVMGHYL